jgi:hypothetical protein
MNNLKNTIILHMEMGGLGGWAEWTFDHPIFTRLKVYKIM